MRSKGATLNAPLITTLSHQLMVGHPPITKQTFLLQTLLTDQLNGLLTVICPAKESPKTEMWIKLNQARVATFALWDSPKSGKARNVSAASSDSDDEGAKEGTGQNC